MDPCALLSPLNPFEPVRIFMHCSSQSCPEPSCPEPSRLKPSSPTQLRRPLNLVARLGQATALGALLLCIPGLPAHADEPVDWEMVSKIRDEGFRRSQVMETTQHLTDVIGPRLTGSPSSIHAQEWTRDKLIEWGLEAHLDGFEFGEGWSFSRSAVHMVTPHTTPLLALPKAWTPGTDGPVRGKVKVLDLESEEDFEEHRGKLKGMILLTDNDGGEPSEVESRPMRRHEASDLERFHTFDIPSGNRSSRWRGRLMKRLTFGEALKEFYAEEGVLATVDVSSRANGIVRLGGGGTYGDPERHRGVPALTMAQEHYNWILRLLELDQEVELELDVTAQYHPTQDGMVYNTIGEIPGTDKADEVVMVGGHLDSWHPATGATDNAAACSVMMEALRILQALDVKPRRTIRIALWNGEEQGLLGSRAYVEKHLADRPEHDDPEQLKLPKRFRTTTWPIQPKDEYETFSVYFNLDNGGGKIRGIYSQENMAASKIFQAWLEPFADLGARTVTSRNTGSTDHISFDRVGLPGFQFIQDPMDYMARTHHSNLDTFDHVVEDDLKQASVIVASMVYHAAMRDELMPRKAMPQEPPKSKDRKGDDEAPGFDHDHAH